MVIDIKFLYEHNFRTPLQMTNLTLDFFIMANQTFSMAICVCRGNQVEFASMANPSWFIYFVWKLPCSPTEFAILTPIKFAVKNVPFAMLKNQMSDFSITVILTEYA